MMHSAIALDNVASIIAQIYQYYQSLKPAAKLIYQLLSMIYSMGAVMLTTACCARSKSTTIQTQTMMIATFTGAGVATKESLFPHF